MGKLTKRAKAFNEKIEAGKLYPIDEAVTLLNELSTVKFKESIDISINLGVDPQKIRPGSEGRNGTSERHR